MKFTAALGALPLVLSPLVSAHPLHDAASQLDERASIVVTTGAPGTKVYPRLEIRQMITQKPNQWNLFLLAMQAWQAQPQDSNSNPASYWGISKIHGVPSENYNNVGKCSASSCQGAWGYCTHSNVLFPAWHRAYMALFEQEFLATVNQIVAQYPASKQPTMKAAAATMRFPFWDWAAHPPSGLPVVPKVTTMKTISVVGPSGSKTINNPLYQINIDNPSEMGFIDFVNYKTTVRYPTTTGSDAVSQDGQMVTAFAQKRAGLQSSVYTLLTGCSDYGQFSNTFGNGQGACAGGLEGIHNSVHNYIGGPTNSAAGYYGGHMTNLPEAAFDPLFWLHHANVDRLFAMWQTLHPNSYGSTQTVQPNCGTWTVADGSSQGANSPLTPFYKDTNGNFWTTNGVRNWASTFKYTYPEFADSDGSASAIASYVNKLYGPSATATAGSSKRTAAPDAAAAPAADVTSSPVLPVRRSVSSASSASSYLWTANIKAPHGVLNGTYTIYVFTAPPASEDPSTWMLDANCAGVVPMFMSRKYMSSVSLHEAPLSTGSVPLTASLQELISEGKLASLNPSDATPYLTKNMQWRVSGPVGAGLNSTDIPGLVVAAASTVFTPPASPGELPTYSNFQLLPNITKHRAGGLNSTASWVASTVGELLSAVHL